MPRGFDHGEAFRRTANEPCTLAAIRAILLPVLRRTGLGLLETQWIALQAINGELNVYRSWRCELGRDLFGVLVVSVTFGRVARTGRTLRHAMPDEAAAARFVRNALARRAGAKKRCGASYRVVERSGFDDLPELLAA